VLSYNKLIAILNHRIQIASAHHAPIGYDDNLVNLVLLFEFFQGISTGFSFSGIAFVKLIADGPLVPVNEQAHHHLRVAYFAIFGKALLT